MTTCSINFHLLSEVDKDILQISTVSLLDSDIVKVMVLSTLPQTGRSKLQIFTLPKILPQGKEQTSNQTSNCYSFFFFFPGDSVFLFCFSPLNLWRDKMATFWVFYKVKQMWLLNNVKCGLSSRPCHSYEPVILQRKETGSTGTFVKLICHFVTSLFCTFKYT